MQSDTQCPVCGEQQGHASWPLAMLMWRAAAADRRYTACGTLSATPSGWHAVTENRRGAARLKILGDLMINLLAATIGFTAGWLRLAIRRLVMLRRARRFWKPFMDGELRLILAVFNEPDHIEWERSGVAGVGDVVALTEIERHLRNIRLADYEISYAHQLGGEQLRSNLVLIGGGRTQTA